MRLLFPCFVGSLAAAAASVGVGVTTATRIAPVCPSIVAPANGQWSGMSSSQIGGVATLTCNKGYTLKGNGDVVCAFTNSGTSVAWQWANQDSEGSCVLELDTAKGKGKQEGARGLGQAKAENDYVYSPDHRTWHWANSPQAQLHKQAFLRADRERRRNEQAQAQAQAGAGRSLNRKQEAVANAAASARMEWLGGPVLGGTLAIHPVTWGTVASTQFIPDYLRFLNAIGGSQWYATMSEYSVPGSPAIVPNDFNVQPLYEMNAPAGPINDGGVIPATLLNLIRSGTLSSGVSGTSGDMYVVFFDQAHQVSGACSSFCGYHSPLVLDNGQIASYIVMPYLCPNGCIGNVAAAFSVLSHEIAESVTDVAINAWKERTSGEEIGDMCAWNEGTTIGSDGQEYVVQKQWSNSWVDQNGGGDGCIANKAANIVSSSQMASFQWSDSWTVGGNSAGSMLVTFTAAAGHDVIIALTNDASPSPQPSNAWQITLGGWTDGGLNGPKSAILQGTQGNVIAEVRGQPCSSAGQRFWLTLHNNLLSVGTGNPGTNYIFNQVPLPTNIGATAANRVGFSSYNVPVSYTDIRVSSYQTSFLSPSETGYFHWTPVWSLGVGSNDGALAASTDGSMVVTFTAASSHDVIVALTNDTFPLNAPPQNFWQLTLGGWVDTNNNPHSAIISGQGNQIASASGQPCNVNGQRFWIILRNNQLSVGTGQLYTSPIFSQVQLPAGYAANVATKLGLSSWNVPVKYTGITVRSFSSYVSSSQMLNFHWSPTWTVSDDSAGSILVTFTAAASHDVIIALTNDAFPVSASPSSSWRITLGGWIDGSDGGPKSSIQLIQGTQGSAIAEVQGQPCSATGQQFWFTMVNNRLSVGTGNPGTNVIFNQVALTQGVAANAATKVGLSSWNVPVTYTNIFVGSLN